ncbi:MAG TPA: response regulator transcription factor [Bacteroidia bacterium]|nr:response regulator transcription factor [Bacteroidia bacterium]
MADKLKILLVEDDVNFGTVMRDYLAMNGYDVTLCADGNKGWSRFSNEKFDLCVLDVMMPDRDGFSLGKDIRKVNPTIPLIYLTARTMKEDIVKGFGLGADDYITKPFDSEILLLKLKALLKRSNNVSADNSDQFEFKIGEYVFNFKLRSLNFHGVIQKLSPREADLLRLLCLHLNDVLSREVALKTIWREDNYFTARSMDVFVTRIRKYFKDDPSIEIINIHGNGFRLRVES